MASPSSSELALQFKRRGNVAFARGNLCDAIAAYTAGLEHDALNAQIYSNRAAALLLLKQYTQAKDDAMQALLLQPDYVKAEARYAQSAMELGLYSTAKQSYEKLAHVQDSGVRVMAQRNLERIPQLQQSRVLPRFQTLSHPPIQISHLSSMQTAFNPLFFHNHQMLIFHASLQSMKLSTYAYDIENDAYSDVASNQEVDEGCYAWVPNDVLYLRDNNLLCIGQKRIKLYTYHCREVLFARFLDQIWCLKYNEESLLLSQEQPLKLIYCNLNQSSLDWSLSEPFPKMEIHGSKELFFCAALVFRHLIFVFFTTNSEIWCIDVWNMQKWIKCKYTFPDFRACKAMVDCDKDYIHFLDVTSAENRRFHFKMDLHQLIPSEIRLFYERRNELLVCGYGRQTLSMDLYAVINEQIMQYVPVFSH